MNQYSRHASEALRTIKRVNQVIREIRTDRKRMLQLACEIIVEERQYDSVWLGEFRHGDLYPSISCSNEQEQCQQLQTRIAYAPFNAKAAKQSIKEKRAIVSQHNASGERNAQPQWTTAAVPIFVNDEIVAVLNACIHNNTVFDAQELQLLEELAIDISFALDSMELESRRREAEDALRISEGRFRRLSENSMVGIVLIQGQFMRYANPALARMFGYNDPSELIDQLDPLNLIAPDYREMMEQVIDNIMRGKAHATRYVFKGIRQDGMTFDVEAHGARTIHARRPAVIATVLDITEREQSRHQLEALSAAGLAMSQVRTQHEALLKAVQLALTIVPGDAANIHLLHQGQMQRVVDAGYEVEKEQGQHRQNFSITPTFKTMLENRHPLLINDTQASTLWQPNPHRQTVRAYLGCPLIVRGEIIGFLNVDSWTANCFAETDLQHLQRLTDFVAATIEHLRLIASLEAEQQRLSLLNQLSQALSETLELEEVSARALEHISQALHAHQGFIYLWDETENALHVTSVRGVKAEMITVLNERLKHNQHNVAHWVAMHREAVLLPDVREDVRWLTIPGVDNWVMSALDVPLEVHGDLIGVLSLLSAKPNAFTEADKQLLKALSVPVALALQNARYYQAKAQQAQAMAEALQRQEELDQMKDEMIQNISHELRTPLALVMGYAAMLQEGALGPIVEEQSEAIDIIARRSRMLRTLVENITLLWKLESEPDDNSDFEDVDVAQIAQTTVKEFQHQAQKAHIALNANTPENPIIVNGIGVQIHRIFDNLVGNAMKFTPEGGHIQVKVCAKHGYAHLIVSDSGIGVPPEKLGKIFERFYQVDGSPKRRYGGTGLGLALVKAIAEAHGGNVFAESPIREDEEHPGARITVQLPLKK